jgi:hypothetical protein
LYVTLGLKLIMQNACRAMPCVINFTHPPHPPAVRRVTYPMIHPPLINEYDHGCNLDDSVDSAREAELGLHVAALFALLLTSTFGNFISFSSCMLILRCSLSYCSKPGPTFEDSQVGILFSQTFRYRSYYCHCLHSRISIPRLR